MLLAPVSTLGFALAWVVLGVPVVVGALPPAVAAVLALVVVALGSRAFHLDGLADLADGLTSGHEPARSLEVMRRGDTGPAGAAALVLVLGLDAAALAALLPTSAGVALGVVSLTASRLAPAVCARRGVPAARAEGLGRSVAGTVGRRAVAALVGACAAVGALALGVVAGVGGGWVASSVSASALTGVAAVLAAGAGALAVRSHAVRRLGGVTGDVVGAAVEVSLAAALVVAVVGLRVSG
jgi:adenosylcobinamide-GDP ribazoletransferase